MRLPDVAGASEGALGRLARVWPAVAQGRVLAEQAHRPWPLPDRPWVMAQTWENLLFAHWPVSAEVLRPLVPEPLPIDEFDGTAWLTITPFEVTGLRARGTPPVPGISSSRSSTSARIRAWMASRGSGSSASTRAAGRRLPARGDLPAAVLPGRMEIERLDGEGSGIAASRHGTGHADAFRRLRPVGAVSPPVPGTLEHC